MRFIQVSLRCFQSAQADFFHHFKRIEISWGSAEKIIKIRPTVVICLKPFPHSKCQSLNSQLNSSGPRATLGTFGDKICLNISPHPLLMSGDQFQDDHHPGRDARSYGRVMHHQGLSRLRLRANTTSSFHNIQQCADLRFVKQIYTTEFPGLKFYTLKVPKLRLFLLKRKQR